MSDNTDFTDSTEFIDADDSDFDSEVTGTDVISTSALSFRPVPFIFAAAFIVVALVAIGTRPAGFDADAIRLWPIAIATVGSASLLALIIHLATRP